ncbi:MAG: phosphoribose diphosphate:decaprenyl-phosphate phosphoribosyltransferase [Ignavibacteria bacterium]|nr:MAG: phosphoribose diphosphate:decaprenyl-phosphate phosphoribosyltransferase [Ignavibacteria bacterium]KAF0161046.1 MAG: phosphoribose diphosphate:decaprenyl-phosphate phosphoribosyltransferase [Ignavibacteria bacterium]
MFSKLITYIKLLRITSWAKNFFVFVPLIFAKQLFNRAEFFEVVLGFILFSVAASSIYVVNDISDAKRDAIHPLKKNRPIASGLLSVKEAKYAAAILFLATALISFSVNLSFAAIVWAYVLLNILYSNYLKQIVIVDIFCIALGFMLRVIGGAAIISVNISSWLILTTLFLSLFLAVMKRRVEIATSEKAVVQRNVLKDYSLSFIDQISSITGGGVIISYALYTVSERTVLMFGSEYFVSTTIFVIFGIFRYMYLVFKKDKGENVVDALFTDLPMIINAFFYICTVIIFIYNR